MRSCRDHHWCKTQVALRCPVIFCGAVPAAAALARRAFLPLVAPHRIFARAMNSEKFVLPDFLSATPSAALSTAAEKKAPSFAERQKAFGQTAPSREKTARP